ncbi:PREDICTED: amidophosphoribosyltransferase 3, chloroplastic [Tarenaya hassleriana]|uniref:amidophosphoribosyltransferase 3, chloroplastic n=1 Tax=Tarenaya hassleriana TaxID=28532 RepID=UPI00053C35BD|nr:PREDICTED: amidophosphoribosyltransferase 3, chloroplastic [Tarenaya hassleriana]
MAAAVKISSVLPRSLSFNTKEAPQNTLFPSSAKTSLKPFTFSTHLSVFPRNPLPYSLKYMISSNKYCFTIEPSNTTLFFVDELHEECGVVGIFGDPEASRLSCAALHALQHRGQEGAGIVAVNQKGLESVKGVGLVGDVFKESDINNLPGDIAIGHVRYSTEGASMLNNVQPFVASFKFGSVSVAHNGNLVNYKQLRQKLEENGSIFISSSDTEVVLHLIATSKAQTLMAKILDACEKLKGAYSMVFATEDTLYAVRDPFGFRPLVMGRRSNGAVVFASETCALYPIGAKFEREVFPGEMVVVDRDIVSSLCLIPRREPKQCVFEHIYFARPDSNVFGHSVQKMRRLFGEILATIEPVDCDIVIPVPDSGTIAARGYADKAGKPFDDGLHKSAYAKRTFIEPSQKIRDAAVKRKLTPNPAVLEGKRVVVVDDSIVRGTTCLRIVRMLREAGAKEVHMRMACPPIIASCYYGVDTARKEELIANRMSIDEIREFIGADSLAFLPLDRLKEAYGADSNTYCYACFNGEYPVTATEAEEEKENKLKRSFNGEGMEGRREAAFV